MMIRTRCHTFCPRDAPGGIPIITTMPTQRLAWFLLLCSLLFIATACSVPATPTITREPTQITRAPTQTPSSTHSPIPPTQTSTDTATPTPIPSNTPTSTLSPTPPPTVVVACETRGVWLNPGAFATPAARARTLADISKSNLNTVFLMSHSLNGNWGAAEQSGFAAMYRALLERDITVYVWLNSFKRIEGDAARINYAQPEEWNAQAQWALDFITLYPRLSGVFFDNLRYPTGGTNVTNAERQDLKNTVQTIARQVKKAHPNKILAFYGSQVDPKLLNRTMAVPQWFQTWLAKNPQNPYLIGETQYRPDNLKYDHIGWLMDGSMDAFMPGDYSSSVDLWNRRLELWKKLLQGENRKLLGRIYFGLGWMREADEIAYPDETRYPGGGADAASAVAQIKAGRRAGLRGVVIFQYGKLEDDSALVNALSTPSAVNDFDAPFQKPAPSCLR